VTGFSVKNSDGLYFNSGDVLDTENSGLSYQEVTKAVIGVAIFQESTSIRFLSM